MSKKTKCAILAIILLLMMLFLLVSMIVMAVLFYGHSFNHSFSETIHYGLTKLSPIIIIDLIIIGILKIFGQRIIKK